MTWHSFELRPTGTSRSEEYEARIIAGRPRFRQMAWENYGLRINEGPFGINSRPALIGAKVAESEGVGDAYHGRMLRAYWEEARNIEDESVLRDIAAASGMNPDVFITALANPQFDALVTQDIMLAYQLGIHGVPATLFNRKYFISGAQPYEVFAQVVEKILSGELE